MEKIDHVEQNLARSLGAIEAEGWEVFAVLPRGEDSVLVIYRRQR